MKFKDIGVVMAGIIAFVSILYGSFWIAKTVSYGIFYEDMVTKTITELVKPECLVP